MIFKLYKSLLLPCMLIITLFACQTIQKENSAEKREKEILDTQKSLVVSFLNKSMPHLALKELRNLVRAHPDDADLQNLMGLTQLSLNNSKIAANYFRRSYDIKPSVSVALNLSSSHINQGNYNRALSVLKNVKKSNEFQNYEYPERIHHNVALAYEKIGRNRQAIKNYKAALKFNPVYYLTLMRLGDLYRKVGKIKTSMKYFYKARTACNICYDPIRSISHNFVALGKPSRALPVIEKFLKTRDLSPVNRKRGFKLLKFTKKNSTTRKAMRNRKIKNRRKL